MMVKSLFYVIIMMDPSFYVIIMMDLELKQLIVVKCDQPSCIACKKNIEISVLKSPGSCMSSPQRFSQEVSAWSELRSRKILLDQFTLRYSNMASGISLSIEVSMKKIKDRL